MKMVWTFIVLVLVGGAFGGGYAVRARKRPAVPVTTHKVLYYVDPMHPGYTSDKPGIAPDCGMTLEPVYADSPPVAGPAEIAESGLPPGAIHVPPERQQLIGVTFATAEWDSTPRALRTIGRVSYDETRVVHVHTRIDGWIEKVFVDFTGEFVKQGVPLLTIYSPEMLASQQELLLAVRARDLMASSPLASAARHGESLLDAARRRLELWDLSADQIQQVLTTGEPIRSVTVHAPASGFVLERKAFPNQKVTPDADLYTIADLSRVWVMADVFESDIASIRQGTAAYLMFPYQGIPPISAKVAYVQPQVDPVTRTIKVRLEAANGSGRLKPEMFVNVEFGIASARRLTVPAGAVLDTGERQTVFVDLGQGYLEPRAVEIGERLGDRTVIVKGLAQGERVVSSGTFLIDSESQLKAAVRGMGAPERSEPAAPEGHRHD
jgi:RND family efflux transporter MFP subunit